MIFVWVKSSTTDATSGTGTAFTPGAPGFASVFYGVCDFQSLVFCVMFCRSLFFLFVLFFLAIVFSVVFVSEYHFWYLQAFLNE